MAESAIVWGPTYEEMLDPSRLPAGVRRSLAGGGDRLLPASLFRITWRDGHGRIRVLRLPPELTGVQANILVLIGKHFPSGSHKVGPAYAGLLEAELAGEVAPGRATVAAPSTGNFALGVAHVAAAKGYRALVVMPEGVDRERCTRLCQHGAEMDLTSGTEGDLIGMLDYTRRRYGSDPAYYMLDQFSLFANYRFHRHVTGQSALEAAAGYGDGRVAAFVAAPGSAGTLGAGDAVKARHPGAVVVAAEPRECPYLYSGQRGSHSVGGVADGLVPLIHNVLNTDYVAVVPQEDCLRGLQLIQAGPAVLTPALGLPAGVAQSLVGLFGTSTLLNILASIKVARALPVPAGHNIVTMATDGFDRYAAVLAEFIRRAGNGDLQPWAGRIFREVGTGGLLDARPPEQKERLLRQKAELWTRFGYTAGQLQAMRSPAFWEEEYSRVRECDQSLQRARVR